MSESVLGNSMHQSWPFPYHKSFAGHQINSPSKSKESRNFLKTPLRLLGINPLALCFSCEVLTLSVIMCQLVQIFAVFLPFVLVSFLFSGFSYSDYLDNNCYRSNQHFDYTGCEPTSFPCGDTVIDFKYPFRIKPYSCGVFELPVSCEHNRTMVVLYDSDRTRNNTYYLDQSSIDYEKETIRVIDPGVQKNNCSTLPFYSWFGAIYFEPSSRVEWSLDLTDDLIFVSCKNPVESKSPLYVDTASCNITAKSFSNNNSFYHSESESSSYSYVVVGKNIKVSDIEETCAIYKRVRAQLKFLSNTTGDITFSDIHNMLAYGFEFRWYYSNDFKKSYLCRLLYILGIFFEGYLLNLDFQPSIFSIFVLVIAVRNVIGIVLLLAFLIYKWQRRHLSMNDKVEEFLQKNNRIMPIRYSYKEIKTMTNNFKEKLGEGGYGLVYKGKLRSRSLVAVKMLNKPKANNGQEFINEVATIGRVHHVNVVRLVGFCVTASKRALVYDYMPNGSLDKLIFSGCPNDNSLSWKKAYDITVGVARGIDYLHQGCNMQILHFDIKPHNILLDENFVPKVSDFGLAKLYPIQDGYVPTLTDVRGTLGYMAPELFYKKIGRVSFKADVYSFGMLLMEMAGRRRNVNAHAEHSSQIYFPSWIYDKFDQGEDMEIGDHTTEEEKGIARKLILIASWCIQMTPEDRPSMRKVLEMLDGNLEGLQLPPKPMFYPPDSHILMQRSSHSSSDGSTVPLCNSVALEIEEIDE